MNRLPNFTTEQWLNISLVPGIDSRLLSDLESVAPELLQNLFLLDKQQLQSTGLKAKQIDALLAPSITLKSRVFDWLQADPTHHLVSIGHPFYPPLLRSISSPPLILYVKGSAEALQLPQIAFVGSRAPSLHGLKNAKELASLVSKLGFTITSGLALGIDGAAHKAALDSAGLTIAVLGNGADVVYPKPHANLTRRIIEQGGCLVSEFAPGAPPLPHHFPRRNRIISGLSYGTVVVEAGIKSGSLVSAKYAMEQGREVFAVPGQINNPNAKGCHLLIKHGATLIEGIDDITAQLYFTTANVNIHRKSKKLKKIADKPLSSDKIAYSIGYEVTPLDLIAERTNLSVESLLPLLLEYELSGKIASVPGGYVKVEE